MKPKVITELAELMLEALKIPHIAVMVGMLGVLGVFGWIFIAYVKANNG